MRSVLGKSSIKKTMRVATVFTGVAAGTAVFAPVAKANSAAPYPYKAWVYTGADVVSLQVCGYKDVGSGEWYCTAVERNPYNSKSNHANYMGSNWKDGKMNVWVFNSHPGGTGPTEWGHTCNTNGAYHGVFRTGGVSLSAGNHKPLVSATSEC